MSGTPEESCTPMHTNVKTFINFIHRKASHPGLSPFPEPRASSLPHQEVRCYAEYTRSGWCICGVYPGWYREVYQGGYTPFLPWWVYTPFPTMVGIYTLPTMLGMYLPAMLGMCHAGYVPRWVWATSRIMARNPRKSPIKPPGTAFVALLRC